MKMHWCIFFSKEENLDHIDKSNTSLEDVKHVKLPLGVGILMNYWQREIFGINTQTKIFWECLGN